MRRPAAIALVAVLAAILAAHVAGQTAAAPRPAPETSSPAATAEPRTRIAAPMRRAGEPDGPVISLRSPASGAPPDPGTTAPPTDAWTRQGIASTYGPGWDGWTASPWPRGTVIEICGPGDCATRTTNDVGPDQRIHPDRVVDLDVPTFESVCGVPWRMGLCPVTVTVLHRG